MKPDSNPTSEDIGMLTRLVNLINKELRALIIMGLAYGFYTVFTDNRTIQRNAYDRVVRDRDFLFEENKKLAKELISVYRAPFGKMDTIIQTNQELIKLNSSHK